MPPPITGLHHVTAIAGDPATNLAFYREVLGLRLVKRTVNFDDPTTHHLYFGDGEGRPGTVLTFFPYPGARRGSRGAGQATTTALAVPEGALDRWRDRLAEHGVLAERPRVRAGHERLVFLDPDGLRLELVATPETDDDAPWEAVMPGDAAVRAFVGVELSVADPEPTLELLTGLMGYELVDEAGPRTALELPGDAPGRRLDVLAAGDGFGQVAGGTVHHIAFRVADAEAQLAWREVLVNRGFQVSPVMDRHYFRSIYFREPGGVLFEIATDPPGFAVDEPLEALGSALRLPPALEPQRERIEAALAPLEDGG